MLTNLATIFVGMGLYFAFLGLTQFVQIPRDAAGYGFGATVLQASVVYLLPGAVTGFLVAADQRPVHRPIRRAAGARRRGGRGHRRLPVHRAGARRPVAGDRRQHPGQRLHQPRLRRAARTGRQRGRRRRDRRGHRHERDRPHGRKLRPPRLWSRCCWAAPRTASVPAESSFVAIFIGGAVTAALAMVLIALSRVSARGIEIRRGALRIPRHEPRVGLAQARPDWSPTCERRTSAPWRRVADRRVEQTAGQIGHHPESRRIQEVPGLAPHMVSVIRIPGRPGRQARSPWARRIG